MSTFVKRQCAIKSRASLVEALAELGYSTVLVCEDAPQHLRGYHGDERPEVAHVIVRRQFVGPSSNDIGFLRGADGQWTAIISEYDQSRHNEAWQRKLAQLSAVHHSMAVARGLGFDVRRTVDEKSRPKLVLSRLR